MPVRYYRRNVKPIISQAANIQRGERWLVLVGIGQIEKNKKLGKREVGRRKERLHIEMRQREKKKERERERERDAREGERERCTSVDIYRI